MTRPALLLACCVLTACAPSKTLRIAPTTPPKVSCDERAPAALLPDVPGTFDQLQVWAGDVIGIYRGEVIKRATTANCLDALRKAGTIR